ncbi:hypothetical protein F4778DRAFT_359797 [Xylariomycetidae sp. FL2044]|nr:hypothetical protein F4778DRAFT_359797 [Xylariomycetidae sp. FL2044]
MNKITFSINVLLVLLSCEARVNQTDPDACESTSYDRTPRRRWHWRVRLVSSVRNTTLPRYKKKIKQPHSIPCLCYNNRPCLVHSSLWSVVGVIGMKDSILGNTSSLFPPPYSSDSFYQPHPSSTSSNTPHLRTLYSFCRT